MDINPKVFVIQKQMKLDSRTGELVPRFSSINKAERFGEMVYLLGPTANPFSTNSILSDLHEKLKHYSNRDCLLLIGNPTLIGLASSVASYYTEGHLNILQWSSRENEYSKISARIF